MYSRPLTFASTIAVRLPDLSQLFDVLDPSPVEEKNLNHDTEQFIVDRLKQLPPHVRPNIVVYLERSANLTDAERIATAAIRSHFTRRTEDFTREIRQLFHRGRVSLGIGLTALVVTFLIGQAIVQLFGEGHIAALLRDCLMIGGWVAMWKPIEIFLYQWRPIVSERLLHEKLSHLVVQVNLNHQQTINNNVRLPRQKKNRVVARSDTKRSGQLEAQTAA